MRPEHLIDEDMLDERVRRLLNLVRIPDEIIIPLRAKRITPAKQDRFNAAAIDCGA